MLCLFIDAWNPDYLRHMPFLKSLTKSNLHGFLEVPLGYTGIIASFVTGVMPDKHRIFDLFIPDSKPHPRIKNPYLLAAIRLSMNKRVFYTPLKVAESAYFKPSLDKTWPQRNCLIYPTVFDLLENTHKSFEVIDWPNHFKNRNGGILLSKSSDAALKLTKGSDAEFIFTHFLDLEVAHEYGINSKETVSAAKKIDEAAEQLYEKEKDILFFSDHGMNDIKREVDIMAEIKNLNLEFGGDILYIVGSTTVEFWFRNDKAKNAVKGLLDELKYGRIINQNQFGISTDSTIFLADFRTGFYPNFFSKRHFKAMHGWDPKQQKTCYILKNSEHNGKRDARIVDFLPTMAKIMGLPKAKWDGKSLI